MVDGSKQYTLYYLKVKSPTEVQTKDKFQESRDYFRRFVEEKLFLYNFTRAQ